VIFEKRSSGSSREAHDRTFFVNVVTMNVVVVVRVKYSRVCFAGLQAWCEFEGVVVVGHDARQSTLRRDAHGPRAHVARPGARAGKANKSREVRDVSRAQHRGNAKKVLRPDELVTFDRITFVEPRRSDNVSGTKEVRWDKKKFGSERVNR
jgi:hypothetical protein